MRSIIMLLALVAASLLAARMLPPGPGATGVLRMALFGVAGIGLLLIILTVIAAALE